MKRLKLLVRLSGQLMKKFLPVIFLQAVVLAVISIFFIVVQPLLLQAVFSTLESGNVSETLWVCMKYAVVLLFAFVLTYINNVVLDSNCFRAMYHIISNIFVQWHKGKGKYQDDGIVFQDITAGAGALVGAPISMVEFIGSLGALLFLLLFSKSAFGILPIILSIMFVLLLVLNLYEFQMLKKRENHRQETLGAAEKYARSLFSEMSFLQTHGALQEAKDTYKKTRLDTWKAQLHKVKGHSTVEWISGVLVGTAFAALFFAVIYGKDANIVTMTNLAATVAILQSISSNVASLLTRVQSVTSQLVPLERVTEILKDQSSDNNYSPRNEAVCIHSETPIILGEQEHVAIIGYNGSGKTTLLNKIAGIPYQDNGTAVSVYGNDAEKLSYENRRNCISIAPKEEMLFEVTALENILMNADEEEENRVHSLAVELNADDFVNLNAKQLSGGQAKRVNLMRACIHSAKIVLADEPTASLDEENAIKAMNLLHYCTKGKMLVVVTHDPESLKDFDRIIIMENLKPVFVGNYEELQNSMEYQRWLKANK